MTACRGMLGDQLFIISSFSLIAMNNFADKELLGKVEGVILKSNFYFQ